MQKDALAILIQALEVVQKSGKVEPDAMIQAGMAYQQAKEIHAKMQPGDVLIVFTPEKKTEEKPSESAGQSRKVAAKKQESGDSNE